MQKYITYLLNDLEQKIMTRWAEQPPHFFESGIPDPNVQPPKDWDEKEYEYLNEVLPKPSLEDLSLIHI